MTSEQFRVELLGAVQSVQHLIQTPEGDWTVKGFIDTYRRIYAVPVDTKVVSKIVELVLLPVMMEFAKANGADHILCEHQNHYPDCAFVFPDGTKYAIDIKTTYRRDDNTVSGMTLGAFTGYFRDRVSRKNVTFPYGEFTHHLVLGVIYSRAATREAEGTMHDLADLDSIKSVVRDFEFFCHEKYRLALDRPGSGNTKNIGSVTQIETLRAGSGPFAELGPGIFDDYWMNYMTLADARAADLSGPPYTNLASYLEYKKLPVAVSQRKRRRAVAKAEAETTRDDT